MKQIFRLCLLFSLLPLFSCAARIDGSLAADGSASLTVAMSLEARISSLIRRLSAAGGQTSSQSDPILDGPSIARSMAKTPGVAEVSLKNTSPSAVEGRLRVSKAGELAASAGGRFITFEQTSSGGRCLFSINRGNGPSILKTLSPQAADLLTALMAPMATGEELSKAEYLELVTSFYGKGVSDEIASSRIRASIDFPGQIKSVAGGKFSGKKANFDIPLLDLLVLDAPLNYEVVWN